MKMVDKKEEDGSELSELSHLSRSSAFTPPPEFVVQLSAADAASEDLFKPEPKKVKKVDLRVVLAQAEADNKFYSIENELFEQHIMVRVHFSCRHKAFQSNLDFCHFLSRNLRAQDL